MSLQEQRAVEMAVVDGLATVTLNRPDAKNAMNQDVADDLYDIAQRIAHDSTVRAVLITGNGKVFSVGGDITVFASTPPSEEVPEVLGRMAGRYHDALRQFSRLQVPVSPRCMAPSRAGARPHLRLGHRARCRGNEVRHRFGQIGLAGDGGNSWFLPRLVAPTRSGTLFRGPCAERARG